MNSHRPKKNNKLPALGLSSKMWKISCQEAHKKWVLNWRPIALIGFLQLILFNMLLRQLRSLHNHIFLCRPTTFQDFQGPWARDTRVSWASFQIKCASSLSSRISAFYRNMLVAAWRNRAIHSASSSRSRMKSHMLLLRKICWQLPTLREAPTVKKKARILLAMPKLFHRSYEHSDNFNFGGELGVSDVGLWGEYINYWSQNN